MVPVLDYKARAHPSPHQRIPFHGASKICARLIGRVPVNATCPSVIINRASVPTKSIPVKIINCMVTLILNKVET